MGVWITIEPITKLGTGNRRLKENEKLQTNRILREIKKQIKRQTGLKATWNESKKIMIKGSVFELGHETAIGLFLESVAKIEGYKTYAEARAVSQFQHVMLHTSYEGYYIPCDFQEPFYVDMMKGWSIPIGSSIGLKRELEEIRAKTRIDLEPGVSYSFPLERDEHIIPYIWWTFYVTSLLSCKTATPMHIG